MRFFIFSVFVVMAMGCQHTSPQERAIVTSTGTILGIEGSQSPTSSSPVATIGYKRAEFAYVPIGSCYPKNDDGDACLDEKSDVPNVLMELYFKTLFQSSLYQRLAVGETAVKQGGAALIFAKDREGNIDEDAAKAVAAVSALTGNSYGCDETCKSLEKLWKSNPDPGSSYNAANGNKIRKCMRDNGLKTDSGRLAQFINLGKFLGIRQVCVISLQL